MLCGVVASAILLRGWGRCYFGSSLSDLTEYFYPIRVFVCRWLHRGIFPYWDPHVFGGYPVIEAQQMALLDPVSLMTARFLPPELGLLVLMATHVCLGLAASWIALRRALRFSAPAAAAGTLVYVFGATFAVRVTAGHFTVAGAMAWMPLAVLACWPMVLLARVPRRWVIVVIVSNAMLLVAGAPQYVMYTFWAQVVTVLVAGRRRWKTALLLLAAAWVGAAVLAAPLWIPTMAYLPFTGRSSATFLPNVSRRDVITVILEALFPYPLGNDLTVAHIYDKNVWETASYPGVVALVFATGAILRFVLRRSRLIAREYLGLALLALALYLALGLWLPGFGSFREPLKARALLSLAFCVLTACGADRVLVCARKPRWFPASDVVAVLLLAIGASAVLGWNVASPRAFGRWVTEFPLTYNPLAQARFALVTEHPELAGSDLVGSAVHVLWIAAIVAVLLLIRAHPRARLSLVILICCLEPFYVHLSCLQSTNPYKTVCLPAELVDWMKGSSSVDENGLPWRVSLPPSLANKSHMLPKLLETAGYDPLMPRSANTRVSLPGLTLLKSTTVSLSLASAAIGRKYDLQFWLPEKDQPLTAALVLANPKARLATIERRVQVSDDPDAEGPTTSGLCYVQAPGSVPADWINLINHIRPSERADTPAAGESLMMEQQQSPNQYDFRVKMDAPGLLVLRTTWLPGWKVRVDSGKPVRPLQTNQWMLGVPLSAGSHVVSFYYRPYGFVPALFVSVIGVLALGGWALVPRTTKRRQPRS